MKLLAFLSVSFAILSAAYLVIGRWLGRLFHLNHEETTPAHSMRDGLDYEPIKTGALFPQHFSAIAAAGPIVGPILAGLYFGWGPAWLWIIFGSILVGGIHDFTALVASVRHKARSVAEIVREYMNPRAYMLFLIFIWFALIYVIIAFADVTAGTFVQQVGEEAPGPGVATSSTLYLLVAVAMGLSLRFLKLDPFKAKLIFIPLTLAAILVGPLIPLDLKAMFDLENPQRVWGYILLGYCFFAAMAPIWSLLQPRGELGGYFLYIIIGVAVIGVIIGAVTGSLEIRQPFFSGWASQKTVGSLGYAAPIFPILFITVACGACSGFHSIVASGTTSKQLYREADARPVAYGAMLMEGFFACISLGTVMILTDTSNAPKPDMIYAQGIREFALAGAKPFVGAVGDSVRGAILQFALLCFATFVFDTLDACTRLARYVLMELMGWTSRAQALVATALSLILPAFALSMEIKSVAADGSTKILPLWSVFWNIFGSSNQLLAALTLVGVTVWLARKKYPVWLTLGPAVFMMAMTLWSLALSIPPYLDLFKADKPVETFRHMQFGITVSLIGLAAWLIVEAILTLRKIGGSGGSGAEKPVVSGGELAPGAAPVQN